MLTTVTWVNPTMDVDGNPLVDESALTGTRVEWGTCNAGEFGTAAGEVVVPPTPAQAIIELPSAGTWCVRAFSQNAGGESDASNIAVAVVGTAPQPPGVTLIDTTVYAVVKKTDGFVFVAVGTAPADTVCSAEQYVNGYSVVPRAVVTWSGSVQPAVVVAKCSP